MAELIKTIILFGLTVMFTVLCFKAYDPKKDNGM